MSVAKPAQPGNYGPDLIDRWKGRAFQQNPDSTISLVGFEDEQVNWEANSALLGERAGPVRAIREIWGADSGTNVTNTESFYRDEITYHYHVRVHPIPPDGLYTSWDYNAHVVSKYYDIIKPDGVDIDGVNDDTGNVDGVFGMPAYFDAPDPTFNAPSAVLNWEEVSGAGDNGTLVYIVEIKGATTAENPAVVPYYRDDACLDDGTGDNPVPRPWPGETSTDPRVQAGYSAENGGTPYAQLTCEQKQGVWGAHGIHYFFSNDTDNAASPEVLTEIDAQQWQFTVPTAAPTNVGQQYGNVVITPLQTAAVQFLPLANPLPPGAADGSATTDQAVAVDTTLSGADVDNCELTFSIVDPPTHGTLGPIANQTCSLGLPSSDTATVPYTPVASFFGTDTFTYKVNDGATDSNPATVSVRVKPQNPPLCATGPEAGCRRPVRSGRAALLLRDRTPDRSDELHALRVRRERQHHRECGRARRGQLPRALLLARHGQRIQLPEPRRLGTPQPACGGRRHRVDHRARPGRRPGPRSAAGEPAAHGADEERQHRVLGGALQRAGATQPAGPVHRPGRLNAHPRGGAWLAPRRREGDGDAHPRALGRSLKPAYHRTTFL